PSVISPMSGSLMLNASTRSQTRFFLAAGALSKSQVQDPRNAVFVQFGGYLYANVSMARIAAVRAPGMSVDDLDAQYSGVGVLPPYVARAGHRSISATLRLGRYASRGLRQRDAERARVAQQAVGAWVASLAPADTAGDDELIRRARCASSWFDRLLVEMMTVTLHAGAARIVIERLTASAGEPDAANAITSGLGGVASAGPAIALWELGRQVRQSDSLTKLFDTCGEELERSLRSDPAAGEFVVAFDEFLRCFGFHGVDELELSSPKWGTDPHSALRTVERLRHAPAGRDPRDAAARLAEQRLAATERVASRMRGPRRRLFHLVVRNAALYAREREATKAALVRALFESRRALNELAHRHGIDRDDIYLLVEHELEEALEHPMRFADAIAGRRELRAALQQRQPPFWFERELPHPSTWPPRAVAGSHADGGITRHQGLGVSAGIVTGRARIILDPNEPGELAADEILVAPQTDPAWTPLFLAARGVVVEYGAVMSHAAIVARELGIPAVVGINGATTDIPTGAKLTVDGTSGVVTVDPLS
ncbi:MAG TPA: PEP-utilizing enzyme, partial [Microthrixaceae bacterium]|nr:PEP-utilizing enzyme [Microthrixaceae bacterium]